MIPVKLDGAILYLRRSWHQYIYQLSKNPAMSLLATTHCLHPLILLKIWLLLKHSFLCFWFLLSFEGCAWRPTRYAVCQHHQLHGWLLWDLQHCWQHQACPVVILLCSFLVIVINYFFQNACIWGFHKEMILLLRLQEVKSSLHSFSKHLKGLITIFFQNLTICFCPNMELTFKVRENFTVLCFLFKGEKNRLPLM